MLAVGRPGIVTAWSGGLGGSRRRRWWGGGRCPRRRDVAADRGKVGLVAKQLGEVGRGPIGVVAGAVEAVVDRHLDPPSERLEQGGGEERGTGHGHGLALDQVAEEALQHEDGPGVDRQQQPLSTAHERPRLMSRSISYRPVAGHGDPHGDRHEHEAGEGEQEPARSAAQWRDRDRDRRPASDSGDEPAKLQSLEPGAAPIARRSTAATPRTEISTMPMPFMAPARCREPGRAGLRCRIGFVDADVQDGSRA